LYVYGVIDVAEQEKIIRQIKKHRQDYIKKPISITFYSSEKFEITSLEPGKTTEKRIDQDAIRVENIE